jgi:predicted Zn-dependent peptidase
LEKVTAEDVRRVAQTYLRSSQRVVATYLPTGGGDGG